MRVVCPNCAAAYEVPTRLIGAGPRPMRCARCAHVWTPSIQADGPPVYSPALRTPAGPVTDVPQSPGVEPTGPLPASRPFPKLAPYRARGLDEVPAPLPPALPPARGQAAAIGWVFTVVVLAALAGAAWQWRTQVMTAWPPSERVYRALGLA